MHFRIENVSTFTGKRGKNLQKTKISAPRAQVLGEGFPPEADTAGQATNDWGDLPALSASNQLRLIRMVSTLISVELSCYTLTNYPPTARHQPSIPTSGAGGRSPDALGHEQAVIRCRKRPP